MRIIGSGTVLVARNEALSAFEGPFEIHFRSEKGHLAQKPNELFVVVQFGMAPGEFRIMMEDAYHGGTMYRLRVAHQGTCDPDLVSVTYTLAPRPHGG